MTRHESRTFVQRLHGRLDHTTDGVVAWLHKHPTSTTLSDLEFDRAQRFDALLVAGPLSE